MSVRVKKETVERASIRVRKSRSYAIFLHGEYSPEQFDFYRGIINGSTSIAVDGGLSIFDALGITPTIALGDFDTVPGAPARLAGACEVLTFPREKDTSDGQLALELAISRGATEILLCGYSGGDETDHVFGNLALLALADAVIRKQHRKISVIATRKTERVWYVENRSLTITGHAGDTISIAPFDKNIHVSATGVRYPASELRVARGSTRTYRNVMTSTRATVKVGGAALVFWRRGEH